MFARGGQKPDQYSKLIGSTSKYPYLVGINTESRNVGTGILVNAKFVLTCSHVLQDSTSAQVISREGSTSARVQKVDDSLDLALLELTKPISAPEANFTEVPLRLGAVVWAVGIQETPGKSNELSVAEIELKFRNQNVADGKILDMQLDGGARPGYSGGPVVVEKGRALVCVGLLRSGGAGANTSNAAGLASIQAFVADYIPALPGGGLGTHEPSIRRLLIPTAIVFGVFVAGGIAKWRYMAPTGPKVTGSTVIVPTPESVTTASGHPTPGEKPFASIPQRFGPSHDPKMKDSGGPYIKVWVNTASGVYHCPGGRWYGKTKHGEYMTQADAQRKGNRPAYETVCQ